MNFYPAQLHCCVAVVCKDDPHVLTYSVVGWLRPANAGPDAAALTPIFLAGELGPCTPSEFEALRPGWVVLDEIHAVSDLTLDHRARWRAEAAELDRPLRASRFGPKEGGTS